MTEVQKSELIETLAALLDPDELAGLAEQAIAKQGEVKQAKAKTVDLTIGAETVKVPVAKAETVNAKVNQWGYGKSPSLRSPNGLGNAIGTIKARLNALDDAMPGFTGLVFIQHIGISVADGSKTTATRLMEKNPWTWIELPEGKKFSINGTKSKEIFGILKSLGYGFSSGNRMWATDSGGNACGRRPGCRVQRVGRAFKDASDE